MTTLELVSLAEELNLADDALDDVVIDVCVEMALGDINNTDDEAEQNDLISQAESRGSDINNCGHEAQIEFLLEHLGDTDTEAIIREACEPWPE